MKESEAKKKMCPKLFAAAIIAQASSPVPASVDSLEEVSYCRGSKCVIWESHEWKQNNPDPKVVPKTIIMNKGEGNCGLKTKELYCEGCN